MDFPERWVLLVIPGALKKRLRPTVVPNLKAHGKFQLELPHAGIQCLRRIKQVIPGNGFLGSKNAVSKVAVGCEGAVQRRRSGKACKCFGFMSHHMIPAEGRAQV